MHRSLPLFFALFFFAAGPASAATTNFTAALTPAKESHPVDTMGKSPTGRAEVTYDDETKLLCGRVTYGDLTGPVTVAQLHQSPPGNPSGSGAFVAAIPVSPSPLVIARTLSDAQATALFVGEIYVNIHTVANSEGELRDTLVIDPQGATVACPGPPDAGPPGNDGGTGSPGPADAGTSAVPPRESSGCNAGGSSAGGVFALALALAVCAARAKARP